MKPHGFLIVLMALLVGCGRQAARDEKQLDAMLGQVSPTTAVEIGSLGLTNIRIQRLEGKEAQAVIIALSHTNRLPEKAKWDRKTVDSWLMLKEGTNTLLGIDIYDDGGFGSGQYHFRLKSPWK